MNARRLHRGAMSVFFVLVAYWVISGLLLAVFDFTDAGQSWAVEGGGPGARLHAADSAALPPLRSLRAGILQAVAQATGVEVASVRLYMAGGKPRIEFAPADGKRERMLRFDATTGQPVAEYFESAATADSPRATRESLKSWHKGNAVGLIGQALGILTGLGVILLAISGLWLFSQLWRTRAHTGRHSLFWQSGTLWQRLHRCVAIVAVAFVLNIAITGVILGVGEFQLRLFLDHQIGSPPYPRPSRMPSFSEGTVLTSIEKAFDQIAPRFDAAAVHAIELVYRDGIDQAKVIYDSPSLTQAIDLTHNQDLGPAVADDRQLGNGYFADWHQVVKRLHRGDIVGHFNGRAFDIAAGLATLYLLLSGLAMFIAHRRKFSFPRHSRAE